MVNEVAFTEFLAESERLKEGVKGFSKKRFLYAELSGKKRIMVGVRGLRGVGKTVMLLQLAVTRENSFYINVEKLVFQGASIVEFVELARGKGFKSFFLDEIHSYHNWARELKLLYDAGITEIFFSGSSALSIQESAADLSRRALIYYLPPLSFKEFLSLNFDVVLPKVTLNDLLDFKKRKELVLKLSPHSRYFSEYLATGAFPFYLQQKENLLEIYSRVLEKIVRVDLQAIQKIDANYVENTYKILNTLAVSSPNEVSYSFLANQIKQNARVVETILAALKGAGVVYLLLPFKKSSVLVRKEQKIVLALPFRHVLASNLGIPLEAIKRGVREDAFVTNTFELKPKYVKTERERKTPDYAINGLTFEVGEHGYKHDTDYYVKDELVLKEDVIPLALMCLLR